MRRGSDDASPTLANGDTENNNNINNSNGLLNKNDDELKASKDNLKSFIERWEEHPNSPYVFDTDANRISPVSGLDAPKRLNGSANSGLSSRGNFIAYDIYSSCWSDS